MSPLQVWLDAFQAMLGETQFFEEFKAGGVGSVGVGLMVAYLMILAIMMLNLLVAVLTTAHARVDQNADQEYKVSKGLPRVVKRVKNKRYSQRICGR